MRSGSGGGGNCKLPKWKSCWGPWAGDWLSVKRKSTNVAWTLKYTVAGEKHAPFQNTVKCFL